jgi:hypothetical protein
MKLDILKMNRHTKIGLSVAIILTILVIFTGYLEFLFLPFKFNFTLYLDSIHFPLPISLYFSSAVLMLGIGVGIISIFVEKKKRCWLYGSIIIIIIGILGTILGYANPTKIGTGKYTL